MAFLLALDALVQDGPADVARSGATCTELLMPGTSPPPGLENHPTPMVTEEPAVRPYASARGPQRR